MPKTEKKKKYTPAITKRFLLVMDEVIKEGKCDSQAEFMESIGEHRTNLAVYLKGVRSPTLEQLATTCVKYGYSPTWCLLGIGNKKLSIMDEKTIGVRVTELEATVAALKNLVSRNKTRK